MTYMFFGLIDEVRIWDVVRTADEIKKGMDKAGHGSELCRHEGQGLMHHQGDVSEGGVSVP